MTGMNKLDEAGQPGLPGIVLSSDGLGGSGDEGTNTSGPRGTYGCDCVSDSAHACAEIRCGYREIPDPCECLCHDWRDDDDDYH